MHEGFGDGAYDMPPLATIQNSGIMWGLGTDGTAANQTLPFTTLYFAVTGKMAGGTKVIRQTISREDALIAHTRKNALLRFSGEQPGVDPGGQAGGPGGARPRLPDDSGGPDQGHQAGDDGGRRQDRVRRGCQDRSIAVAGSALLLGEVRLIIFFADVGDVHPGVRHLIDGAIAPADPLIGIRIVLVVGGVVVPRDRVDDGALGQHRAPHRPRRCSWSSS